MFQDSVRQLRKSYEDFEKHRQACLGLSRSLRAESKSVITFLVKGEDKDFKKKFHELKEIVKQINKRLFRDPYLLSQKAINEGLEEYVEAVVLYRYLKNDSIPTMEELKVNHEAYICGLADMTGELVRVVYKDPDRVHKIYKDITDLYNECLPFIIQRNNVVREKLNHLERNIRKLEEIMYEVRNK